MTNVSELHDQAMDLAQDAIVSHELGRIDEARRLNALAMELEASAAELLENDPSTEPTRSILYQSAASLANDAGLLDLAERYIAEGLSGSPPPRVRGELRSLWETVNFGIRLRDRGRVLSGDRLRISLSGPEVAYGAASYNEVVRRIDAGVSLLRRTAARLQRQPFDESGRTQPKWNPFEPIIHAPSAGSFVIELELVTVSARPLSLFATSSNIVRGVVEGVAFVQSGEIERLRNQIPEEAYFDHFLSVSRELAPDGKKVNLVDISGAGRDVAFTVPRPRLASVIPSPDRLIAHSPEVLHFEGTIEAGIRGDRRQIGLKVDGQKALIHFNVREGLVEVVRRNFGDPVRVTATREPGVKGMMLQSVDPID